MARPRKPEGAKVPVSLRFDRAKLALIDEHRAAPGRDWSRQEWFDRLVDRGLQGAGLLPAAATAPPEGLPRVGPRPDVPPAVDPTVVAGAPSPGRSLVRTDVEPLTKTPKPSRVRR